MIISENFWRDDLDDRPVLVSIECTAYNHEKYIRDALEGFVMQKTNFRFEAIVHDDCSTDGTAEIIREYTEKYPSIIKPIYEEENQYSKRDGSLNRILRAHFRGKYVAYCEGDDYWTDPLKLQKQVDFLESHPDYSMIAHNCIEIWENGYKEPHQFRNLPEQDITPIQILKDYPFQTASILIQSSILTSDVYLNAELKKYKIRAGDKWLMVCAAYCGKVRYLNQIMSVYRRHESGMSFENRTKWQIESILEKRYFGIEFGGEIEEYANECIASDLIELFWRNLRHCKLKKAFNNLRTLFQNSPYSKTRILKLMILYLKNYRPFRYFAGGNNNW